MQRLGSRDEGCLGGAGDSFRLRARTALCQGNETSTMGEREAVLGRGQRVPTSRDKGKAAP